MSAGDPAGPTRLVVLDHVARLSGAEINLLKVASNLRGFDVTVVLAEPGDLADRLRAAGVAVEIVPLDRRAADVAAQQRGIAELLRGGLAFLAYGVRLRGVLRRLRPDLVVTNSSKAHLYGAVAAALARVPLVCHVHDRLTGDTYALPALLLLRAVFGYRAAGLIANSASTAATLPARAAARTAALPCPVDEGEPLPHRPSDTVRFAVVGRISPWKGQDLAVRAFARWRERTGQEGRLTIVGGALFGEDEFGDGLLRLLDELDVADAVTVTGHVMPERVQEVLAGTDVLLHTSRIPEPFGQVVVEGMHAGVAVVAADAGGPAEIVHDGVDGLLYPVGDPVELAAAMERLTASPDLRARLAAAGRETARNYAIPAVLPRYEAFLRRIGGRPAPAPSDLARG